MSISLTDLLIDSTRIPARKLLRDYYELESLQNKGRQNDDFAAQSLKKIKENISFELLKHRITSNFFFQGDDNPNDDLFIYVIPIDSKENFSRTKPFFGIMATLFKNNQPEMSVINFPAMKELIYVEKGRGVWVEKSHRNESGPVRIKTSNISNIDKAHIVIDDFSVLLNHKDYFQSFANIEVINSPLYNLYLLCHGIIDITIISVNCDAFLQSLSLIANEANASIKPFDNNKNVILANLNLS
jgi:myo-inositol-1(or 4)-monophosphatase